MEKRRLGKTDMEVSVLGFGGSEIGYQGASLSTVERLLGSALDAGLNVIDTAECYRNSEELIGQAVKHRRNDYYLFTKCGHASGFDAADWDPKMLADSIDRSLKLLQTDYIDLIHLHSCSEALLRDGEVIDVLKRAQEAGKTRYIGYSGDSSAALYAIQCGAFDTLQTSVNIADQQAIQLTLAEALQRQVGVIAKRPIANVAWSSGSTKPENAYHQKYWERLQQLDYDFLKGSGTDAVENALRFTLSQPAVATAIVGTTNPERWVQNAVLADKGVLADKQLLAIRSRWNEVSAGKDWGGQG
jgi:aryl-alcohol dehydrogenase-like predicted oxidoreductase